MELKAEARFYNWFEKSKYSIWNICLFSLLIVLLSRLLLFVLFCAYAAGCGDTRTFLQALNIWDAEWYQGITTNGYTWGADYSGGLVNWAFFPLFSLAVRGANFLTGIDINLLGFVLNIIFQTAGLVLLMKYVLETRGANIRQAVLLCVLFALGSYTFYFASYYTESLYLFLFAGGLLFLHRRQYLVAGVFGFFLALTKNTGVVLLLGMLIQLIYDHRSGERRGKVKEAVLGAALTVAGLLLFMAFLWMRTGDPLAFLHAQSAWEGSVGNPFATIINGFASGEARQVFFAVCAVAGLMLCVFLVLEKRYAEAGMAFALLLIPVSVRLQSIPRYIAGNAVFMLAFTDLLLRWNKKWVAVAAAAVSVAAECGLVFLWFASSTFLW